MENAPQSLTPTNPEISWVSTITPAEYYLAHTYLTLEEWQAIHTTLSIEPPSNTGSSQ